MRGGKPLYTAVRAEKCVLGHNWAATVGVPRESAFENRGNAQPEYPLRGTLVARLRLAGNQNAERSGDALYTGADANPWLVQ